MENYLKSFKRVDERLYQLELNYDEIRELRDLIQNKYSDAMGWYCYNVKPLTKNQCRYLTCLRSILGKIEEEL